MRCSRCRREAVLTQQYSGLALCAGHLREDVEARARKEIRGEGGIRPGDRLAVVLTGRPEDLILAHFLHRTFSRRRDMTLMAVEGSGGSPATEAAALPPGMERAPGPDGGGAGSPADAARRAGATVFASGECLDDLAGRVLAQVLLGEVPEGPRPSPLRTLTPFRRIPREEIHLYGEGIGVAREVASCRAAGDEREELAAALLADHASRHPSAPHALLRLWDSLAGGDGGPLPRKTLN
ncbi:MAG: hypothetical protein LUQ64_03150 [Methanomicrobiales archaeon]|nr:hypothetical protein [Methanomicrobiales archaeon]